MSKQFKTTANLTNTLNHAFDRKIFSQHEVLDKLNKILIANFVQIAKYAHFGAIDDELNKLVLFVNNQSYIFKLNNLIPKIIDKLEANGFDFNSILIRVQQSTIPTYQIKKNSPNNNNHKRNQLLTQMALDINRPDLIPKSGQNKDNEIDAKLKSVKEIDF